MHSAMPLLGKAALLLSFDIVPEAIPEHDEWHTHEHLPEQRIRGADAGLDCALLATGYSQDALENLARGDLAGAQLEAHGATGIVGAIYRSDYTPSSLETCAQSPS